MNTEHENSIYTFLNMNDTEHRPWMVLPSGDLGQESGRSKSKLSSYQWLFRRINSIEIQIVDLNLNFETMIS